MASLLFTIGGAVVNTLALSDTNFVFSRLTDHGAQERKRHDLALEKLQRAKDEWNRDRMKRLDFVNKRLREKIRREHISTMLMKQCLNIIEYLQNKYSLYHLSLNYQILIIHQRIKKIVNYCLLWWVQALQHIPCTSTVNKCR